MKSTQSRPTVRLGGAGVEVRVYREVRQCHKNYSPQHWSIRFRKRTWSGCGISVNGTWITSLRCANDVVLFAKGEENYFKT